MIGNVGGYQLSSIAENQAANLKLDRAAILNLLNDSAATHIQRGNTAQVRDRRHQITLMPWRSELIAITATAR